MTDLIRSTLRDIQDDLESRYMKIENSPEVYRESEQLKQQLDDKMEVIRGYLEGRWSLDV